MKKSFTFLPLILASLFVSASPIRSMLGTEDILFDEDYDPAFPGLIVRVRIFPENLECSMTFSGAAGIVQWGDGSKEYYNANTLVSHRYNIYGDYIVKVDNAVGFQAQKKSQVLDIVKWSDGMSGISALYYRNLTTIRTIAGNGCNLPAWTFAEGFRTHYGDMTVVGPFPNTDRMRSYLFAYCYNLKTILMDGIIKGFDTSPLAGVGRDLVPDADGYKTIIRVGNSCSDLLEVPGFPGDAPQTTKWICSDGIVAYKNGGWRKIND